MKITKDQVHHVARLARLGLRPDEVEKFQVQLSDILNYVEMLNKVDTDGVAPTAQVTGLMNVFRKDEVSQFSRPARLLAASPLPIEVGEIKVKNVL